jgi:serine/threonine protein kinase
MSACSNVAVAVSESASHVVWNVKGVLFSVPRHFVVERALGAGAYGVVSSAVDVRDGARVAIKKITHAFDDVRDCKRTLREIKLLRHFCAHENGAVASCFVPQGPSMMTLRLHKSVCGAGAAGSEQCRRV